MVEVIRARIAREAEHFEGRPREVSEHDEVGRV
jgi:hypothetical protein